MSQCDTTFDRNKCRSRSVTYMSWSSDFALYLEDYLMDERRNWDNESVTLNVGQLPLFHAPVALPSILSYDG